MKIAILNDTHLGVRNSSNIFLDNSEKFYSKIFFPYLRKHNIKSILHLGDYYDNRLNVSIKSLQHNRKYFLDVLRKEHIHMDVILGNHDVYYKSTNDLNSLKELLGHFMAEVNIVSKPTVIKYDTLSVGLVPWINTENYERTMDWISKCEAMIIGGHFGFSGFPMSPGMLSERGLSSQNFEKFSLVMSGHFHTKSSIRNINYLGSQLEFTWSDAHDPKYFHILDTETGKLEAIQNYHTLYKRVVYDSDVPFKEDFSVFDDKFVKIVVSKKGDISDFEDFVQKIQTRKIIELKIDESFIDFSGESIEDENLNIDTTDVLISTYVDEIKTGMDKDILKSKIFTLYKQAELYDSF